MNLGSCGKYAYRFDDDGKISFATGLPALEAHAKASEEYFRKMGGPTIDKPIENFLVAGATQQVLGDMTQRLAIARQEWESAVNNFARMKSAIHRYATDTLLSLELGGVAESIFEAARIEVDAFVSAHAPQGAEQLLAANERMLDGTPESRSAALTSCRRLLVTVADNVFPARADLFKGREVGPKQYKNRLLAYLEERIDSGSTSSLLAADLEHLVARLDALNDKASKGVHDSVTIEEARLVLIETYLFLAELARLSKNDAR